MAMHRWSHDMVLQATRAACPMVLARAVVQPQRKARAATAEPRALPFLPRSGQQGRRCRRARHQRVSKNSL